VAEQLHHFLLVYSYAEGRLIHQDEFTDEEEAASAYTTVEREYRGRLDDFEIVLVGSDSIETIMRTHGHYFATVDADSPFATVADLLTS
jgi:hypothetical protein